MLTHKGRVIERAMDKEYGDKKGKQVFYATKNAGKIKGVEKSSHEKALRAKEAIHGSGMNKHKSSEGGSHLDRR